MMSTWSSGMATAQEALLTAAERGDAARVRDILRAEGTPFRLLECADVRWDKTPLQWAANHGWTDALRALIDAGGLRTTATKEP